MTIYPYLLFNKPGAHKKIGWINLNTRLLFRDGFSLLEIIVVLIISAIIAHQSIRLYKRYQVESQLTSIRQSFQSVLIYASNFSLVNQKQLLLMPLIKQKSFHLVEQENSSSDWKNGWSLLETESSEQQKLRIENVLQAFHIQYNYENYEVILKSSLGRQYIQFYQNGEVWPIGRFIFCHPKFKFTEELIISRLGQIRVVKSKKSC